MTERGTPTPQDPNRPSSNKAFIRFFSRLDLQKFEEIEESFKEFFGEGRDELNEARKENARAWFKIRDSHSRRRMKKRFGPLYAQTVGEIIDASKKIYAFKKVHGLPTLDIEREKIVRANWIKIITETMGRTQKEAEEYIDRSMGLSRKIQNNFDKYPSWEPKISPKRP